MWLVYGIVLTLVYGVPLDGEIRKCFAIGALLTMDSDTRFGISTHCFSIGRLPYAFTARRSM